MFKVGSISVGASGKPDDGHFYWHYRALARNQVAPSEPFRVLGRRGEDPALLIPVFAKSAKKDAFSVSLLTPFRYSYPRLTRAINKGTKEGVVAYQFYEGSLADFICVIYLARKFPEISFFFNFFWPQEWQLLWTRRPGLWRIIAQSMRNVGANVEFLADTEILAEKISSLSGVPVSPYPSFSPFEFGPPKPQLNRRFDLLVTCKRRSELEFALSVISQTKGSKNFSVALLLPKPLSDELASKNGPSDLDITVFVTPQDEQEYVQLLRNSRVVFLVYLKDHYALGSSGKLVDAGLAGCRMLIPEASGLSSQAKMAPEGAIQTFTLNRPQLAANGLATLVSIESNTSPWGRNVFDFENLMLGRHFEIKKSTVSKRRIAPPGTLTILWFQLLSSSASYRGKSGGSWARFKTQALNTIYKCSKMR